ncbi:hypothetical protein A2110_01790 [Candidatus Jorgensenbacteria bacterium GWA1_54_12]|uniref:Uncharacterized protein n=1 Tax=Candidatus Jorgensenbacteria bacterium GWA1_54_12 TaxID=1798468 RepID=A0A1F6BLK4_9BACT|nr:MAG: hypothetical protein A2110_01790 [Candidatus Jorgensenbacteria bacterium GWA1_54_12]
MTQDVSDLRANANEAIVRAAQVIGKSKQRRVIFEAIYKGKRMIKTAEELANLFTHIKPQNRRRILALDCARALVNDKLVEQVKDPKTKRAAYRKVGFYTKHRDRILRIVDNPKGAEKIATKQNPIGKNEAWVRILVPKAAQPVFVTVGDIYSFATNRKSIKINPDLLRNIKEEEIKERFKKIIKESGVFKDWGGEKSDLYSTRVQIRKGKRVATAIVFKGRATKGKLTPEKMGKRGDQIDRLFQSAAELFLVVYPGQIDESIVNQMHVFALAKATTSKSPIYYGVIDHDDLLELFS